MRDSRRTVIGTFAATLLLGSSALTAQESGQPGGLEEVVVTARFRQESLQSVPLAISAFTAEALNANGATSVVDVAKWAPNVTIDALGQGFGPTVAANVRGLGYADFKATVEPTVTFYVDDVVLARPTGAIMDLLDLERVEVLRGPQGTLFGKNAIGGVVRMISRKPGEGDGKSNMELTLGSLNRTDLRGSFETPLVADKLFSRVSFVSKRRDGYMNQVDYRCAMIRAGTPQLAGVNDGIVGWNTTTNTPIMGVVGSAADNNFAIPGQVTERGTDSNCVIGRLGDENAQAARIVLRYTPNDIFEVNWSADVTDQNNTSPYELTNRINPLLNNNSGTAAFTGTLATQRSWNRSVALPLYGVPYDQRFQAPDLNTTYANFSNNGRVDGGIDTRNESNVKHWGTSASLDVNLKAVQIKAILAHRDFDSYWGQDSDGSPLPYSALSNRVEYRQDTIELRVGGNLFGGRTSWTAGYFNLDSRDLGSSNFSSNPCISGDTSCQDRVDWVNVDSDGVFLNTQTDLTKKLGLGVGVRRTHDVKNIVQLRFNRTGAICCGFAGLPPVIADDTSTDPMVSLSYAVTPEMNVYATYQKGFRGGGTNARATTAAYRIPFGPETLANREIGIKSDFFDKRLRVNASLFDMVYENIQNTYAGVSSVGTPTTVQLNGGAASLKGYEVESRLSVGKHWSVESSLARLQYHLDDFGTTDNVAVFTSIGFTPTNNGGAPDANDTPARSPKLTASLQASYYLNLRSGAEFSTHIGASWRDATWWGVDGDLTNPDNYVPANTLTNFRVTWASPQRTWESALFCTNCGDVRVASGVFDTLNQTGRASVTYIRPREWGVSMKRAF